MNVEFTHNLRAEFVIGLLENAVDKMVNKAAADAVQTARDMVVVDTGFLRDSIYGVTKTTTYGAQSATTAVLSSRHNGNPRPYISQGPGSPSNARAVIGAGAVYAFFAEQRKPFLFPAVVASMIKNLHVMEKI